MGVVVPRANCLTDEGSCPIGVIVLRGGRCPEGVIVLGASCPIVVLGVIFLQGNCSWVVVPRVVVLGPGWRQPKSTNLI